jgi:hypothetical protein
MNEMNMSSFYRYTHDAKSDFAITLELEFGLSSDIFVVPIPIKFDGHIHSKFAKEAKDAIWKNERSHATNEVNIKTTDKNYCARCEYLITIFSA